MWAPEPVWTDAENLTSTGIRSPYHPARSEPLYRLSYRGPRKEIRSKHEATSARAHAHTQPHARTHTHKYVLGLLIAFPQQQWLLERASLRYTHIACLVDLPLTEQRISR